MNEFESDDPGNKTKSLDDIQIKQDSIDKRSFENEFHEKNIRILPEITAISAIPGANKVSTTPWKTWRDLTKDRTLTNLYSALSITFLTFPFALIVTLTINEKAPEPILTYASSVMSNVVGSVTVLLYSEGVLLIRSFTGVMLPILADAVEKYGKEGFATTSLYVTVMIFIGIYLNFFRAIKFVPFFIFEAIKTGTGFLLIFGEIYSLLNIKSKHSEVTLASFVVDLFTNYMNMKFLEVSICLVVGFGSFFLQTKYKRFPWPAIVLGLGIILGYLLNQQDPDGVNRIKLLRDLAPSEFDSHNSSLFDYDKQFLSAAFSGLKHPELFVYSCGLLIMVLFEVCMSISIHEDHFEDKIKRKQEFFGIGSTDLICFFLGVLPVSCPVGRIQFVMSTGSDHKIIHAFSIVVLLILYFGLFTATGYMPICLLKSMNVLISMNLVKLPVIAAFKRYSNCYFYAMIAIVLTIMSFNLAWCIIFSVAVYFGVYLTQVKQELVEYVDRGEGNLEVILKGRFVFRKKRAVINEIKSRNGKNVILNFSKVITTEINYIRNYKEMIAEIEKFCKEFKIVGLEKGMTSDNVRNPLLNKLPYIRKHLTQVS